MCLPADGKNRDELQPRGGGGGALNKVLYGEAPPRGLTHNPFILVR